MKSDEKLFPVFDHIISDQLIANKIAAQVREHFLGSSEEIQQSKNTEIILINSEQTIKGEHL